MRSENVSLTARKNNYFVNGRCATQFATSARVTYVVLQIDPANVRFVEKQSLQTINNGDNQWDASSFFFHFLITLVTQARTTRRLKRAIKKWKKLHRNLSVIEFLLSFGLHPILFYVFRAEPPPGIRVERTSLDINLSYTYDICLYICFVILLFNSFFQEKTCTVFSLSLSLLLYTKNEINFYNGFNKILTHCKNVINDRSLPFSHSTLLCLSPYFKKHIYI